MVPWQKPLHAHKGVGRLCGFFSVLVLARPMKRSLFAAVIFALPWTVTEAQQRWTQTSPPAYVSTMAADGRHAYVGTRDAGLFRYTPGTGQFASLLSGLADSGITALTVAGDGTVYAGVSKGGLFASTDDGETWSAKGLAGSVLTSVAVGFSDVVLAATSSRIYRSVDNGATWTYANAFVSGLGKWSIAFDSSGIAYAGGTGRGVFHTLDSGKTWVSGNIGLLDTVIQAVAVDASGNIFAGTHARGVYRSSDHGMTWVATNTGLDDSTVISLAADDSNRLFAGTATRLYCFDPMRGSWAACDSGLPGPGPISALARVQGSAMYALTSRSLCRTPGAGSTWSVARSFLYGVVMTLAMDHQGRLFAGTDGGGCFCSTDFGTTWMEKNRGLPSRLVWSLAVDDDDLLYAAMLEGGVYRSSDGGEHWCASDSSMAAVAFTSIMVDRNGDIYAGSYDGVFRSSDHGTTWSRRNAGLADSMVFAIGTNAHGDLIVGLGIDGIFLSTDQGEHWDRTNAPSTHVLAIARDSSGRMYAGMIAGIVRSTDNGWTWDSGVGEGLTDPDVEAIAADRSGLLFAGTHLAGVFRSSDMGNHWEPVDSGLTEHGSSSLGILCLLIDPRGYLYAGTYDAVYRTTSPTTGVTTPQTRSPYSISLEQNYPNPFNPTTVISGQWTVDSRVRLVVYDLLGREVTVLAEGRYPAGKYTFTFDGTHVSSGVYFYRLKAGGLTAVRRMTLVK